MTSSLSPDHRNAGAIGWSVAAKATALTVIEAQAEALYREAEREAKRRGADHVSSQFVDRAADTLAAAPTFKVTVADAALQGGELLIGLSGGAALGYLGASETPSAWVVGLVATVFVAGLILITFGLSTLLARRQ